MPIASTLHLCRLYAHDPCLCLCLVCPSTTGEKGSVPVEGPLMPGGTGALARVALCGDRFLAVTAGGCTLSWGSSFCPALGHGDRMSHTPNAPRVVKALVGVAVTQVACGESHR